MRKRILKLLVPVLCTLVLFVGVAGTSHAASHRSAPARAAVSCPAWQYYFYANHWVYPGDSVYGEARAEYDAVYQDDCLTPAAVYKVLPGCGIPGFPAYCDYYHLVLLVSDNHTGYIYYNSGNIGMIRNETYIAFQGPVAQYASGEVIAVQTREYEGSNALINDVITTYTMP